MNLDADTRGIFRHPLKPYGKSVLGTDLLYVPCKNKCKTLVVAGIHGEEPESTFLLSRSLRLLDEPVPDMAFVLCANPDGMILGTRGNYNGIDLNRNFPSSQMPESCTFSRSILEAPRDTALHTFAGSRSEPEVNALLNLIESLKPESLLSIHAPIGCVDAPRRTSLVDGLCSVFNLPWVPDIGYPTPGSLGTWCKEHVGNGGPDQCVTLELPRMSLEALFDRFGIPFAELLASCP